MKMEHATSSKRAAINEKAKKYQKDLDLAYGETKVIENDSEEITEIKELIVNGEITYIDFKDIGTDQNIRREVKRDESFRNLKESIKKKWTTTKPGR